jgi:hypothetical protein
MRGDGMKSNFMERKWLELNEMKWNEIQLDGME